jgi:hypothetical protein
VKPLSDFLSPQDVREIQYALFDDASAEYLRSGPLGDQDPSKVSQRIRNVKSQKIRRTIDAVVVFDGESKRTIRPAWSHYMALVAGTHVWPDANHRTALLSFAMACKRAFHVDAALEPEEGAGLVSASKAMRDKEFLRRGRYYTVKELADGQRV